MMKKFCCLILPFFLVLVAACSKTDEATIPESKAISYEEWQSRQRALEEKKNIPVLELSDWHWTRGHSYVTAEGLVKNISEKNLKNVEAEITYRTKDRRFITTDSALVEYNPILPGQTTPFKVMTRFNPAMDNASIEFKNLGGSTIPWKNK